MMGRANAVILAIDTTSRRGSVAVARGGRLLAVLGADSEAQQSAVLWSDVDLLLGRLGLGIGDVDAFAVARGPGAFTGVRVGMAAAAGFARATGKPLYGATSFELTARATGPGDPVWVVLNAYRNEVYAQRFTMPSEERVDPSTEPIVDAPDAVFARLADESLRLVGGGVEAYASLLDAETRRRDAGERWTRVRAPAFLAGELAELVGAWLAAGREPVAVEPCYVRQSEAEINLKAGRLESAGVSRVV